MCSNSWQNKLLNQIIMNTHILKTAAVNAFATALYIVAIASFLFYAPKFFGENKPDTVFMPIGMLSLLVFSAALVGVLIFGRPILWYLDGKKQEAVYLLASTLAVFCAITIIALSAMLFLN